jgi:KaiC/GvpD/RAD55 family RecA-like ATPase
MAAIEIIKNKKLDLNIPEFLCDVPLGSHLEEYDMLNCLNGYKFTALIGKPGSGKTSMLISWLTGSGKKKVFKKVFDNVLLVMPSTSRQSLKKNIFEKHHEDKMFEELDLTTIETIHNRLLKSSEEGEKTLLILDDVGASLKNNSIQTILRKIIYNRRHLKCHIVILLQSFLSCPKEVRKLLNNVIMFKPSKVEFENLMAECFEIKRDAALDLMNFVYKDPHDALFLNIDNQRMFKDYDEIILHNDDEILEA